MNTFFRRLGVGASSVFFFCSAAWGDVPVSGEEAVGLVETQSVSVFSAAMENFWNKPVAQVLGEWRARWEIVPPASPSGRGLASAYLRGEKVFGVSAEQVRVESEKGAPVRVEIMFFNKGDTASRVGMGYGSDVDQGQKLRFSEDAWKECLQKVEAAFASVGEKRRCSIGSGKLRRRAEAWKVGETVFVLDAEKNEFVRIIVVPVSRFGELVSSAVERVKSGGALVGNLEKRDNGDVLIGNVPMVNQGGKGYCLPATFERVLRYYGIEDLDMHKIAEISGTDVGGGTAVYEAVRNLGPVVKKNRLAFSSLKMSFSKIRQSVDRGVPVIWSMYSTPDYEERMQAQTQVRKDAVKNISGWGKRLSGMGKLSYSREEARVYGHVCLIIGYNQKTKELCVSNSWGEDAREQWVRFADAEAVTSGDKLFVLKN